MKRLKMMMMALVLLPVATAAQTRFENITVNDASINRSEDFMTASMDLDLTEFGVTSNRAILLTPYIVNGNRQQALPSLGFYGRDRWFYYVRNDAVMVEGAAETSYRAADIPEFLPYLANTPFEDWMTGSDLMLEKRTYGCCGDLLNTEWCTLGHYDIYRPSFLYISPAVEQRKARALEGNAFVDYPVSQTVIYPEYHNNVEELAKIRATIDSVRLDPDVTVTSIFIKGFASPESPYDNNARLAKGRTESIRQYVLDLYDIPSDVLRTAFEPENWEGLREYVVQSDLPYKNQILTLIDGDEEPDRKEWLIKTRYKDDYKYLLENCFPYLRRTYYRIDYVVRSFTESDVDLIRNLVTTRPQNLSLQEFYLAAKGLDHDSEQFAEIFDVAVRMYPNDPVANLNAANAAMQRGDLQSAAKFVERSGNMPESIYARGVLAALNGDTASARSFLEEAATLGITQAEAELEKLK